MDGYRFVQTQEVTFRDLDVFGHVNNAVYLTYVENARLGYLRAAVGVESVADLGVIVARVSLDFRSGASLRERLEVGARTTRVGRKSFELEHEVRGPDGRLVAEASTTLVTFDYERDETMPVPLEWRRAIEAYEARSLTAP